VSFPSAGSETEPGRKVCIFGKFRAMEYASSDCRCRSISAEQNTKVAQLSQRDRAAGWVSFGQKIIVKKIADCLNFGHFAFLDPLLGVYWQRTRFISGSLERW